MIYKKFQQMLGMEDGKSKSQVQSLLILELMTLQLFFSLQGRQHSSGQVLSGANQDTMLRSMEGLLDVCSHYLRSHYLHESY